MSLDINNQNLESSKWDTRILKDVADVYIGKTPPRKEPEWFSETEGIKWVSIKDLGNCGLYVKDTSEYLTPDAVSKFNVRVAPKNTVLLSFKLTVGRVAITTENMVTNEAIAHFKIKNETELSRLYLYYYLKTFNYNTLGSTSSIAKAINSKMVREIPIVLPPIEIQDKISKILFNIDSKIEVLNDINKNLLSIADAIFINEFRNFEDYSEEDLITSDFGLIPKNWCYNTLDEISDVAIGKTPPRKEPWWFSETDGIKWISIKDLGNSGTYIFETSEYLTEEAIEKFNMKLIPEDTVILSFKLTVGRLGITTEEMVTNEAIAHFKLNNSPITKEYLYLYLKNFNYETLGSTSSIAKAINSKIVKKIPILIPSKDKLNSVSNTFESLFEQIKCNQKEITNLIQLRDTLLPKLMSGEIDVSEINCDL